MKAFYNETSRDLDPDVAPMIRAFGNLGMGTLYRVWNYIGRNGRGVGKNGEPLIGWGVDAARRPFRLDDVAAAVDVEPAYLDKLMSFCAERSHADPIQWRKKIIVFPWMAAAADEYTKRQLRIAQEDSDRMMSEQQPNDHRMVSLGLISGVPVLQRENQERSKAGTRRKPRKVPDGYASPWFERFWGAWGTRPPGWCKVARQAALLEWYRLGLDERLDRDELTDRICQAVGCHAVALGWGAEGGQYPPHASTWLHGKRWEDEVQAAPRHPQRPTLVHGVAGPGATGNASTVKQEAYAGLQRRAAGGEG